MNKIIKNIFIFIIAVFSLIFICPSNIYAEDNSSYIGIEESKTINLNELSLVDISFKDYSSSSAKSFGLSGTIKNSSDKDLIYISEVSYYDSNYKLIAQNNKAGIAIIGTSDFTQMSPLAALGNNSASEIKYYSLSLKISENQNSQTMIPSQMEQYKYREYVIDKFIVDIVVNDNNTFDITETITAYFNVSKHGIFRTIPLNNSITRLDGTISRNHAKVTNININNEFTKSKENGDLKLKIGSASRTFTGEQTYVIKYTYNLGKDPMKIYDELYYNIIGTEWDTVIGNVSFSITMPKEFDSSKLGFSAGSKGSTSNSKVKYNVSGNTITGSYDGVLEAGEALTVRCELPEGYFINAKQGVNIVAYIAMIAPFIMLGISIFLWDKYGKDEEVIDTVEFYPPEGKNSLDVGFLYKGSADNKDVTSLLIYLANKGYIKITEIEEKKLFSKGKGFRITKLKDYDGKDDNERRFLKGLFRKKHTGSADFRKIREVMKEAKKNGEKLSYNEALEKIYSEDKNIQLESVTKDDLENSFYITMNDILKSFNSKGSRKQVFDATASSKLKIVILMIIATFVLITLPPVLEYIGLEESLIALLFPGIGLAVIGSMLSNTFQSSTKPSIFLIVIFGALFVILPIALMILPILLVDKLYLIAYICGFIAIIGMLVCLKFLPKRTSYGNKMFGKIKGFKNFLETAEKEKLEAMVMEDPTYFYDILPYTYVLGVSDKWIKKFESIAIQPPTWYEGTDNFNMTSFSNFMDSTMSSASSAMSSDPSSDSSSGGGSSGGGSGGGGGGSW